MDPTRREPTLPAAWAVRTIAGAQRRFGEALRAKVARDARRSTPPPTA